MTGIWAAGHDEAWAVGGEETVYHDGVDEVAGVSSDDLWMLGWEGIVHGAPPVR